MSLDTDPTVNPYLTGAFAPIHDEIRAADLTVLGELPAGLAGTYLRTGPNPQFAPLGRYHLFDGDGMLHGVTFADGRASYANRWVESRGLLAERRAGAALYGGLSEFALPSPEVMAEGGMMKHTANTNVVRHAGRILALMEASPPTEVDLDLATIGEYDFDGALEGPMTAHPRWDAATGELHFFGYSPFPPYLRYHVADADGRLVHSADIDLPRSVMMHDFVITATSVVFFDLPAIFDVEAMMLGRPGIRWEPEHGARIGVMPRFGTDADVRWTEIEPCYVFHFLNAFDTADGGIRVDGCRSSAMPITFGDDPPAPDEVQPMLHRWLIDADGSVHDERLDDRPGDFPRVADGVVGAPNRHGYLAALEPGDALHISGVTAWDLDAGTSATFRYGDGGPVSAGEAVFAADPDGAAENDGWLLNIVTDLDDETSRLVVLDARDVTAGPVAEVLLPQRVPFGFHGNYLPHPS